MESADADLHRTKYAECSYVIPDPGDAYETEFDQFDSYWDANEKTAFMPLNDDYEITAFSVETGKPEFTIKRDVKRCSRTDAENTVVQSVYYTKFSRHAKGVNIVARKQHRAVMGIEIGDDGNLWVRTVSDPCSDSSLLAVYDVYDMEGNLLKQIRFMTNDAVAGYSNLNRVLLTKDRLYVTTFTEGNPGIIAYDLPNEFVN